MKANPFANNFEKFYSEESIVNQENISISGITVFSSLIVLRVSRKSVKESKRYISQINIKHKYFVEILYWA